MSNGEIHNTNLEPEGDRVSANNLFELEALLRREFPNITFTGKIYSMVGYESPSSAMLRDLRGEMKKRDELLKRTFPTPEIVDELNDHKKKIISQMEKEGLGHLVRKDDKGKIIVLNEDGIVSIVKKD